MFKQFSISTLLIGLSINVFAAGNRDPLTPKEIALSSVVEKKNIRKSPPSVKTAFAPFTGKASGDKIRMRLQPDLDGYIVREINKNEIISVIAEEGTFYCIEPPESLKAYIFRSFVLDGVVEGNRVNVRLEPDLEAPIIGHVSSGDKIEGNISSINRKWLEILPPATTRFYVSKEFIDYAGGPELKAQMAKRKETVEQLLEAANLYTHAEMVHEFEEIDFERIKEGYLTIIHDYTDFPKKADLAKQALSNVQEDYLQKRIAYLEEKAALVSAPNSRNQSRNQKNMRGQLQSWDPVEEGLFASWEKTHEQQNIDSFYEEQKLLAVSISGVLEPFKSSVNNKPGDFIIKNKNLPVAYVYSTKVDLEDYVGKNVTLIGSPRSNNSFAFPAYFVHDVE